MKKSILFLSLLFVSGIVMSQKLTTTSAVISFDATTEKDKLPKAENKTVIGSLDKTTGVIMFEAAVNNFSFSNPLMHTHFNSDKWMNSPVYPKFTFTGKITKPGAVKYSKNGTYNVSVTGDLTIKGVTKKITTNAKIIVTGASIATSSSFKVTLADYGISGQQPIESGKVNKEAKVNVTATF